jgi:hypothetical protein
VLRHRASETELLDRPDCDPPLAEKSYRFMRFVNRIGGGTRVVRHFLEEEMPKTPVQSPVRILDLGSGTCDIPLAITRWAVKRGYPIEFTCIEHNTQGLELARQALGRSGCRTIELTAGDLFTYQPRHEYDYAVGSMVLHHFSMQEISRLITHLRGFVRKAMLINDLQRCLFNYAVCRALTLGSDPVVRHDALLSVRRGFRPRELSEFLETCEPASTVSMAWFCRVAAVVRFDRGAAP